MEKKYSKPEENPAPQIIDDDTLMQVSGGANNKSIGEEELWFEGNDVDRIAIP